ncbi:fibrobacter succinogenes major paralogous domain-containing protein [uncultured Fibrobacter sp.]|uniref:fibrobacter succinogenes major paralogous domain-containing protein n=1 Tax=uncultured Fibrobacter sp. TaxID=261512 RepID=UPI0025E099D8|nr:fibrobacter succinogenes major paralogous domain-containing protein [uncultured Fibrobacter sp.]
MKKHVIASIALLLAACGDDVTQINQTGLEVVETAADLPKCSSKNKGEQVLVTEEAIIRVCVDGEWFATKSGIADDLSCTTKELKDGSGLKIICNGDSIGVVLNGEKGDSGKDGKDAVLPNDSLEADSERVAISLDSLVGVTQKGPFMKGSTVYLYELSDGRTLKQTNGNFTSNITSEDGRYKFTARDLVSQYAMVVVDGYYRNEVTGKTSGAPIRLKAITDMRKRSSVNVNILTHLEFDRVYSLVTRGNAKGEKLTVKQAKKQAQKEILKLFDIELDDATDAEDMDVFGKTDADAALLAISILLQGDRSESDMMALLSEISNALAENGEWNDSAAKARFADWALKADTENKLAQFRKNVSDWHLGDTVPEFEKFVRNYIVSVDGLDECGSKKAPVGTFAHVPNVNSAYFAQTYESIDATKNSLTRLVCDSKGGNHWRIATSLERDTVGWTKDSVGTVRKGAIDTSLTYVYEDGWRLGTELDRVVGFGCVKAFKDSVAKMSEDDWYKCDVTVTADESSWTAQWLSLNDYNKDMLYWESYKDSAAGTLVQGPLTQKIMVWDDGALREASDYEQDLKRGCVTSMYYSQEPLSNGLTYTCEKSGWSKTGTFVDGRYNVKYKGVQIGDQVWMAENLNYNVDSSFCPQGDPANCAKYGRLYRWAAAVGKKESECGHDNICSLPSGNIQGVCPAGWHLPSRAEWETLLNRADAGRLLKSTSGWPENGNGLDAFGFSALPAGSKSGYSGYYDFVGSEACFWSSTEGNNTAVYISLEARSDEARVYYLAKNFAMSVRCVKN